MSLSRAEPIDYTAALNEEQAAAAQAADGPVLAIAAAGTGKTRTLVYRVAYLVEQGVPAENILLLTFTNRAAREMLERARELVGPTVGGLWGGTFHHLCNRLLRRHATAVGYANGYGILDQDDGRTLVRSIINDLGLKDRQFPKPDVILSMVSYAANTESGVEELVRERYENHPVNQEDILRVARAYGERKLELNAMDFDDLLINGLRLLEECPSIAASYQERFRYVMVDEYQDTNVIQARLVDELAARHRNLLVVGDDFQSIYSWRGANYKNIIDFPSRYPDAQIFKLETNYRSVPEILDVANICIAGNPEQFQKTLRAVREPFRKPCWTELRDGSAQAHYVVDKIHAARREGYQPKDICILYRAHFHSMELQLELERQRIPYVITSGVRFFEQAHIKDICCVLRLIHAPGDQLAFLRLMMLFPRIGQKTAEKLWLKMNRRFNALDANERMKLLDAMPKDARPAWRTIDHLLDRVDTEKLAGRPAEIVHGFADEFYESYAVDTFDNYERRMEDVQELVAYCSQFENLESFLNEMALLTNVDTTSREYGPNDEDAVRLTTIHQAKGLEWKVVIILWMSEGMFPSGRSLDEEGGEAEERRLFYVALTRAEDELYLCTPQLRRQRDGGTVFYSTSRFVRELPGDSLTRDVQSMW